MGMLDGTVAVITGAGRGIGRGEAVLFAREGARVVVNDLGGEWDGTGADPRPASQVAEEIAAAGGEAVPPFVDGSGDARAQTPDGRAPRTRSRLGGVGRRARSLR